MLTGLFLSAVGTLVLVEAGHGYGWAFLVGGLLLASFFGRDLATPASLQLDDLGFDEVAFGQTRRFRWDSVSRFGVEVESGVARVAFQLGLPDEPTLEKVFGTRRLRLNYGSSARALAASLNRRRSCALGLGLDDSDQLPAVLREPLTPLDETIVAGHRQQRWPAWLFAVLLFVGGGIAVVVGWRIGSFGETLLGGVAAVFGGVGLFGRIRYLNRLDRSEKEVVEGCIEALSIVERRGRQDYFVTLGPTVTQVDGDTFFMLSVNTRVRLERSPGSGRALRVTVV